MNQKTAEERSAPNLALQGGGWQVGDWQVDAGLNEISTPDGETRRLEPRVMELLVYLAQNPGVTLSREQILDAVWQGASVVDGVLPRAVSELRAALGDDARDPHYVQTVPRRGYRLIATVGAESPVQHTSDDVGEADGPPKTKALRQRALVWLGSLALVSAVLLVGILFLKAEIARQVVNEIDGDGTSPEALAKTREGRYNLGLRSGGGLRTSRDLFLEAIVADGDHAPAWAGLAECYIQLANYQILTPAQAYPAAREAAEQAVALDPSLPEAHVAQGLVDLHMAWDLESAEASYRRAISLGPSYTGPQYASAHQLYAELLSFQGRHNEALSEIRIARRMDPFSAHLQAIEGLILLGAGHFEESAELLAEVYRLEPVLLWTRRHRAYALERIGRSQEAAEERVAMALAVGESAERLREMVDEDGLLGFYRWRLAWSDLDSLPAAMRSEFLAGVGDDEEALRWTDRAVEEKGEFLLHLQRSPAFDRLRDHPRFRDPLVAAGFDPSIPTNPSTPTRTTTSSGNL